MFAHIRPMLRSMRGFLCMFVCGMFCTALAIPALVLAQSASEEDILVEKVRFTLESFLADPDMQWFRDHMKEARGMLIVPQFIKGAFFVGGSGGSGVLVARDEKTNEWSYPDLPAGRFGDVATIEVDLVEWNYGRYEGLTPAQIHATAPGWLLFRDGGPGREQPGEIGERVDRVIEKARAVNGNVILFAHGHVLRVFAARWLGLPPSEGQRFLLDTATMNILSYYRDVPAIKRWNAPVQF